MFFLVLAAFLLPTARLTACTLTSASLEMMGDDQEYAWLNGNYLGGCQNLGGPNPKCWRLGADEVLYNFTTPADLAMFVAAPGCNIFAVKGTTIPSGANGMTWSLTMYYSDCPPTYIQSDGADTAVTWLPAPLDGGAGCASSCPLPAGWDVDGYSEAGWFGPYVSSSGLASGWQTLTNPVTGLVIPWTWGVNAFGGSPGGSFLYRQHFQLGSQSAGACSIPPLPSPTPGTPPSAFSPTFTRTPSASRTSTPTRSPTASSTPSLTSSPTASPSPTATGTLTSTATLTSSPTPTSTPTATHTVTFTPSGTRTVTPTATASATQTVTFTPSATYTATPTATASATQTVTFTPSATYTATPTATASATQTVTFTPSATYTATPTVTASATQTVTFTPSATYSATPTATPTATQTVTFTATTSTTATASHSPTRTATSTLTETATATPSRTSTPTWTLTATTTATGTQTLTSTPSLSPSASATVSATFTITPTSTPELEFHIVSVYPNPIGPKGAQILVEVPFAADVTLQIFNVRGELVWDVKVPCPMPGYQTVFWDAQSRFKRRVSFGNYYLMARADAVNSKRWRKEGRWISVVR